MSTRENIVFADLSHTGTIVSANFFPLAIGYVAANLLDKCSGQVDVELFKYPDDLSAALSKRIPRIIGFSNYSWNLNLSYEYIKRIKLKSPKSIVVMGGPNYGLTEGEVSENDKNAVLYEFASKKTSDIAISAVFPRRYLR